MNTRDRCILEAAYRVFSRFGIAKTTMADVAQEAGVARQTVYNAYQNKDDLLRAVTRKGIMAAEETVAEAWAKTDDFEEKIDRFFELVPLTWYDAVQASPQAAEMFEGIHRIASAELDEATRRWNGHFTRLLETHFDTSTFDAPALADFIYSTAANAKHGTRSRSEIERRLAVLKQSVLALIGPQT